MRSGRNYDAVSGNFTNRRSNRANLMHIKYNFLSKGGYKKSTVSHHLLDQTLDQLRWIDGVSILFEKNAAEIMRRKRGVEILQRRLGQYPQLDSVFLP